MFAQNVQWTPNVSGMANVRVDMIKFRKSDQTVLAATHGRGMFTAVWEPNFANAVEKVERVEKVEVYPNPTQGNLSIRLADSGAGKVFISDLKGSILREIPVFEIAGEQILSANLSGFPGGVYILKVNTSKGEQVHRIIKE